MARAPAGCRCPERWGHGFAGRAARLPRSNLCEMAAPRRVRLPPGNPAHQRRQIQEDCAARTVRKLELGIAVRNCPPTSPHLGPFATNLPRPEIPAFGAYPVTPSERMNQRIEPSRPPHLVLADGLQKEDLCQRFGSLRVLLEVSAVRSRKRCLRQEIA